MQSKKVHLTLAMKALVWVVIGFLVTALALFLPAGTIAWAARRISLILLYGFLLVRISLLLNSNPGLLEQRLSLSQPHQKALDEVFILVFHLGLFCWPVLMGLG